jgi:hypothetical protein
MTWIRGRHAFKGGADTRFISDSGFDAFGATPIASIGAGGVAVQNISAIRGIGQNAATATNLLNDLSGSLSNTFQTYNSPGSATPGFLPGQTRYRNWLQRNMRGSSRTISSSGHP